VNGKPEDEQQVFCPPVAVVVMFFDCVPLSVDEVDQIEIVFVRFMQGTIAFKCTPS